MSDSSEKEGAEQMNNTQRLKLSMRIEPDCFEEELRYAKNVGFDGVYCWLRDEHLNFESMARIRDYVESFGLQLFTMHSYRLCKNPDIQLNRPDCSRAIDEYCVMLENLGRVGIPSTNFTWEPIQTRYWDNPVSAYTRGAETRCVSKSEIEQRNLMLYDRVYEREELWENMFRFLDAVVPVAEQAGVGIALHPNDPPIEGAGGVPFLIRGRKDYERLFTRYPSRTLGMEFCTGCWLEGQETFGDICEGFRQFQKDKRVWVVHFRNVDAPLPDFKETYIDNGYYNMRKMAQEIVKSGYNRSLILDHVPLLPEPNKNVPLAYSIGYLKALFDEAYEQCDM